MKLFILALLMVIMPSFAFGFSGTDYTTHPLGLISLLIFVVAYYFIAAEEKYHLNKAKPALFAGTFLFIIIGAFYAFNGLDLDPLHAEIQTIILEVSNIFFFLFVAMAYIEVLIERNVFAVLKHSLVSKGYGYKKIFWLTGIMAFFISPIADNLTTALIMSTVLMTITKTDIKFLVPAAINVVVSANAGGAWSPFGDITTLMAWSAGKGTVVDFLFLFPASFIGYVITAYLLSTLIPDEHPESDGDDDIALKDGAKTIMGLGIFTIFLAVTGHQFFHLPAMWGMMAGLSLLSFHAYYLKQHGEKEEFDVFHGLAKVEYDTLIFFFGILSAVGALHFLGYLALVANGYEIIGATTSNILVGFLSAIVDNVPVMSAILKANPVMPLDQWMLITLTAGIGGSLIAFGSAAGVGVMGKMKGIYTFTSHFRYAWMILVGYIVSIIVWYIQYQVLGFYIKP